MSESRDRKRRKPGGGTGGSRKSSGGRGAGARGSKGSGGYSRSKSGTGGSKSSRSSKAGGGRGRGEGGKPPRDGDKSHGRRGDPKSSGRGSHGKGGSRDGRGDGRRSDGRSDSTQQKKLPAAAEGLPRHVVEALMRVTPPQRQNAALSALGAAAEAFSDGQYHLAVKKADHAKDLASRDATIREILGLASYRVGDWATALRELRTYRRLSGETTHMPVEMDALRAMGRDKDVTAVWQELRKLGGGPAVKKEARVVYASFLIDTGDLDQAADVAGDPKIVAEPWPEDLRLWYVGARIAAMRGQRDRAKQIADAILLEDPGFPGLDELDRLIDKR